MAVKFLEPGGDSTFNVAITTAGGFWNTVVAGTSIATDFIHGGHLKSIKYGVNSSHQVSTNTIADTGSRISCYVYLNALPSATNTILKLAQSTGGVIVVNLKLTSAGVIQLFQSGGIQIGSNGAALSTGIWYRLSIAYTITSTTVNRFEIFKDGVSTISVTNATLGNISTGNFRIGNVDNDTTLDLRSSDHYIDNSSALTDPGNIWVTAKRPNANGTSNQFTTQIGSGGSGYGTGHSPQVNERPLNNANGWSIAAVGVTTEEYNIEGKSVGDIDISAATIVDYMGWVDCKTVLSETNNIILNNAQIAFTTTANTEGLFTGIAGSSSYPAGTGTDIGMASGSTATTVSLYECGVIVAYIPGSGGNPTIQYANSIPGASFNFKDKITSY